MENADAIIIGSGQGGVPLAADLAASGQNVVVFERGRFGGSCVNYGCTPSKAFLAAAHGAGRARRMGPLGVSAEVRVDFPAVMTRVRKIRDDFEHGVEAKLQEAGIRIIRASASFSAPRTVTGGGTTVRAPLVVIDTGTTPAIPAIAGLAQTPYLTNENFFEQQQQPQCLIVLGGGYIGLELGQGLRRLGSEVHIIDSNPRVLSREEADASAELEKSLQRDGVVLHLNCRIAAVRCGPPLSVTLDGGEKIAGDALLVTVGRTPNTGMLNLPASGIEVDAHGYVKVDEHLRTTCEGVYALGDVAGQPQFTHVSWEDYRRLKAILSGAERTRSDRVLAYTTFTEPQVARVGIDAAQAREKGIAVRVQTLKMDRIARAIEWGEDLGFYRLFVDASDKIVGATLVGYEAGELVHIILAHIEAGSTWQALDESVHIHPTYAEGLPSLARLFASSAASAG
jgi:pyruvate/2-oxoglutarate dehydrogenase complex dihydrolipoamide dehydrogenase (E3) component